MPPTDDRLVDTKAVAQNFGVHPETINRWRRAGRIPFVRTPGGKIRFDLHAVHSAVGDPNQPAT